MPSAQTPPPDKSDQRPSFVEDFRRFFTRGLATLLPTLITLFLVIWVWNFLWNYIGQYIIDLVKIVWLQLVEAKLLSFQPAGYIRRYWDVELYPFRTELLGVTLSILLVYFVGIIAGNLLGKAAWRMGERFVMRIPFVRAIYPAVKQVTDFILEERGPGRLAGSRVVAVQPHEQGIWSIGMVTGRAAWPLNPERAQDMVTVFVPSTPTAFTGYVLIVPQSRVVELPMTVEEALRLLVSGGVITPGTPAPMIAEPIKPRPVAKAG